MTRPRIEELLAAYASGAELPDAERAAVEAHLDQSTAARAEVDAMGTLFAELRAAQPEPPPASEAVVRAVRIACAEPARRGPLAWLGRRWTVAVPVALAAATAVMLLARAPWDAGRVDPTVAAPVGPAPVAPVGPAPVGPAPGGPAPGADELWLDGQAVELADLDDAAADDLDRQLGDELAALGADDDDGDEVDVAPDDSLDWVDDLDDAEAESLDSWLAEHPS